MRKTDLTVLISQYIKELTINNFNDSDLKYSNFRSNKPLKLNNYSDDEYLKILSLLYDGICNNLLFLNKTDLAILKRLFWDNALIINYSLHGYESYVTNGLRKLLSLYMKKYYIANNINEFILKTQKIRHNGKVCILDLMHVISLSKGQEDEALHSYVVALDTLIESNDSRNIKLLIDLKCLSCFYPYDFDLPILVDKLQLLLIKAYSSGIGLYVKSCHPNFIDIEILLIEKLSLLFKGKTLPLSYMIDVSYINLQDILIKLAKIFRANNNVCEIVLRDFNYKKQISGALDNHDLIRIAFIYAVYFVRDFTDVFVLAFDLVSTYSIDIVRKILRYSVKYTFYSQYNEDHSYFSNMIIDTGGAVGVGFYCYVGNFDDVAKKYLLHDKFIMNEKAIFLDDALAKVTKQDSYFYNKYHHDYNDFAFKFKSKNTVIDMYNTVLKSKRESLLSLIKDLSDNETVIINYAIKHDDCNYYQAYHSFQNLISKCQELIDNISIDDMAKYITADLNYDGFIDAIFLIIKSYFDGAVNVSINIKNDAYSQLTNIFSYYGLTLANKDSTSSLYYNAMLIGSSYDIDNAIESIIYCAYLRSSRVIFFIPESDLFLINKIKLILPDVEITDTVMNKHYQIIRYNTEKLTSIFSQNIWDDFYLCSESLSFNNFIKQIVNYKLKLSKNS